MENVSVDVIAVGVLHDPVGVCEDDGLAELAGILLRRLKDMLCDVALRRRVR